MTEEHDASTVGESVFVLPGDASPGAITGTLQALLPTRHHRIIRHQFTVLDTFDGRVRRAGAQLTRTQVNGTSSALWQPRGGGPRLVVRLDQPANFAWDFPEGRFQQVVSPVIGVRRLLELAEAEAYGSLLDILDDRGKTIARLQVESSQVRLPSSGQTWQAVPTVITLTGLRGYQAAYERLVPVLESRPGIAPCPEGLQDVMLRQIGAFERRHTSVTHLDLAPGVRADVGARQIHLALLGMLEDNEPGLRASLDTEFLHDFRVGVRRTRALLGQIGDVFQADRVEHFKTEFSWIGRLTGPPRDVDVLVLALRECRDDVPAADLAAVTAFLCQAQQREYEGLGGALDSDRYRRLLWNWGAFLERPILPEPDGRNADRLLRDVVAARARRLSRRIADRAGRVDERTPTAELHGIRIDAKKLRYLIDVTPGFYEPADFERILSALKKLQAALGDFNDADAQQARLLACGHALGAAGGPTGALLALGRLAERSRQRREGLRKQVARQLARFCARGVQSACGRAFRAARAAK